MSGEWIYVWKYRPEKLLGLLEHLWRRQPASIKDRLHVQKLIRSTLAHKLCGESFETEIGLRETFLPLPDLQRTCGRFMNSEEPFPFLEFEMPPSLDDFQTKWSFLNTYFLVGKDVNLRFLLRILRWIRDSNGLPSRMDHPERILDLYIAINARSSLEPSPSAAKETIL